MPQLYFYKQFAAPIKAGTKVFTIRDAIKAVDGEMLSFYNLGYDHGGEPLKGRPEYIGCGRCNLVQPVRITSDQIIIGDNVRIVFPRARESQAHRCGFSSWLEMLRFFQVCYKLPFSGYIHGWRPLGVITKVTE